MSIRAYINPRNAFLLSAMMLAVGIGCSNILMSWGQIGLVIAFIWDGNYKQKIQVVYSNKRVLALASIYLIFVAGLIHTSNYHYAFHDLKIKLPLLIVPLFFYAFFPLSRKELDIILHSLYLGTLITIIFGSLIYLGVVDWKIKDMRNYSPFIAHVRVGTLLVFCIFMSVYFCFKKEYSVALKVFYIVFVGISIIFLLLIQSLTAVVALIGTIWVVNIYGISKKKTRKISIISFIVFIFITGTFARLTYIEYQRIHQIEKVNFSELPRSTIHGSVYRHDTTRLETVNGHYIWINICNWELWTEWNKRSNIDYYANTKKGWVVDGTLIKYLASKGLKKNAEAVQSLSDKEIKAIENGADNYLNVNAFDLRYRINQVLVELDKYQANGDPNQLSFATRLETWKVALHTIQRSMLFGFGTGDVRDAMEVSYSETKSALTANHHLNPHQQYFTIAISTGIIGLTLFIMIFIFPLIKFNKLHILFLIFISIAAIGMLDEDTLETQAGATQFIFLYVLTYMLHKVESSTIQ